MQEMLLNVTRQPVRLTANHTRVITRPFYQSPARNAKIVARVQALSEAQVQAQLDELMVQFGSRHRDVCRVFRGHFNQAAEQVEMPASLADERRLLIGAFFTLEYSVAAAALFNPSIVLASDQSGMKPGHCRVILSFRATGEGHVSSIEFRSAILNDRHELVLDPICAFPETPELASSLFWERDFFRDELGERRLPNPSEVPGSGPLLAEHPVAKEVVRRLPPSFNRELLEQVMGEILAEGRFDPSETAPVFQQVRWVAMSNYRVQFAPQTCLSDRILFPVSEGERRGIEDARFVRVTDADQPTYCATYVAFDGTHVETQFLETSDFLSFRVSTINGRFAGSKGMALFPRKLGGQYAMISRVDGENIFLMRSDDLRYWNDAEKILEPEQPWEFVQMGNCGSPIETDAGWLLLTHGVGPMRRYCIGAVLLDLEDPSKVIARPRLPLLAPDESERDGYVPNVVYSCGSMVHNGRLVIPYAMSDSASSIATVPLDSLLDAMFKG